MGSFLRTIKEILEMREKMPQQQPKDDLVSRRDRKKEKVDLSKKGVSKEDVDKLVVEIIKARDILMLSSGQIVKVKHNEQMYQKIVRL